MAERSSDPLFFDACEVRELFSLNQDIRAIFGGPPFTNDVIAEIKNFRAFGGKDSVLPRKRVRMGMMHRDARNRLQAYISFSLVLHAEPTSHETRFVWSGYPPKEVHGLFIRRILVHPQRRNEGLGTQMLRDMRDIAQRYHIPIYCDVNDENRSMKLFAYVNDGKPILRWNTQGGTPMVRYAWE